MLDSSITDDEEVTIEEVAEDLSQVDLAGEEEENNAEEYLDVERKALEDEIKALKVAAEERARQEKARNTYLETLKTDVLSEISPESGSIKRETGQNKEDQNHDEMQMKREESQEDEQGTDDLAKFKEKIEALIEKNGDVWRCVVCGKSADESKGRDRLKNHVQIHMDLTHACDVCGKTCNTKSALGQHMYKQHRDVVEEMANKKNDSKRFKCEDCGMKSTTNAALEQHMSKRHKESIAERKVKVEKHNPTESFSSELDQDSGTQLDKEANDQEMEELQEGESILEIDLDTAEVDDSAEDNLTDDEDVNDQDDEGGIEQSRRVGEVDKEKIEAMIEKVFFVNVQFSHFSSFSLFQIQVGGVWRCIECNKLAEDSKARFRMKNHVQTHMQVFIGDTFCKFELIF